jgi:hypothetical protein
VITIHWHSGKTSVSKIGGVIRLSSGTSIRSRVKGVVGHDAMGRGRRKSRHRWRMGRDIQAKVIASRKSEFRTMVGVVSSVRIWCFCCGEKERRLNVEDGIEAEF